MNKFLFFNVFYFFINILSTLVKSNAPAEITLRSDLFAVSFCILLNTGESSAVRCPLFKDCISCLNSISAVVGSYQAMVQSTDGYGLPW